MSRPALKDSNVSLRLPEPKAHLQAITPYTPGKSKAGGEAPKKLIKLSSNENPLGPSPKGLAAFRNMENLHRYPDGTATPLREAIAAVHGIDATRIVCGAGSDELIGLLICAYAGKGDEVLFSEYGFLMYKLYALVHGATPVIAPENAYTASVDALLAKVTDKTKIVFLANPNNPTGTCLPATEVARLRDSLPSHVLLVVDAAYAEYVDDASYDSGKTLVESTENTVMLRTFSKIYGLSGLRLGWAYAPAAVVDALHRVRSPFNVSAAAMVAGIAALDDADYIRHVAQYNAEQRALFAEALTDMGLAYTPSAGNFLLVHFPKTEGKSAGDAMQHLMDNGIIPRGVSEYGLPNALRITVGTEEDNQIVTACLREFMA